MSEQIFDTAQTLTYYKDYLTHYLPKIIVQKKPVNTFANGDIIPTVADLDVFEQHMRGLVATEFGQATEMSESTDIAVVDVNLKEVEFKVWGFAAKAVRSLYEANASRLATKNGHPQVDQVLNRKLGLVYRAIEDQMNLAAAYGRNGATGFLNDPDVPVITTATDLYADATTFETKIRFIGELISDIGSSTLQQNPLQETGPSMVLLPPRLFDNLNYTFTGDGTWNVRQWLLRNVPELAGENTIRKINGLEAAQLEKYGVTNPGDDQDMIVIYQRDPDVVHRRVSAPFPLPVEYRDMHYHIPFLQSVSETVWEQPQYARYIKIPKFTA